MLTMIDGETFLQCELCLRHMPKRLVTLHHLTPRSEGGKASPRTPLCKPCHKQVHVMFSNKDLARRYPSLESLRSADDLQAFLKWIVRQEPDRNFRTVASSGRPKSRRQ